MYIRWLSTRTKVLRDCWLLLIQMGCNNSNQGFTQYMLSEVLTQVLMGIWVFRDVMLCWLLNSCQCFKVVCNRGKTHLQNVITYQHMQHNIPADFTLKPTISLMMCVCFYLPHKSYYHTRDVCNKSWFCFGGSVYFCVAIWAYHMSRLWAHRHYSCHNCRSTRHCMQTLWLLCVNHIITIMQYSK